MPVVCDTGDIVENCVCSIYPVVCRQFRLKKLKNFVFNTLPNDKILDWTKLKAFADDKLDVAKIMISVYDWVENIVGKEENAGYHNVFKRFLSEGQ